MNFLRSIKSMGSYWRKALFSTVSQHYWKDLDEVKFLNANTHLPIVQRLKEMTAKDILPHVMNRPLGDIISKDYLQTQHDSTLQDIVKFMIDITYLDIIQDVMNCHNKDIPQPENILQEEALFSTWINRNMDLDEVKFLLANADLSDLKKLNDISGKDVIQSASKEPLKTYYPDLNDILHLTLQDIIKFMIDYHYSELLKKMNKIFITETIHSTGSSSDEDTGSSSDKDTGSSSDEYIKVIQVTGPSSTGSSSDKDDKDTGPSSDKDDKDIKVTGPSSALAKALAQRALEEASSIINEQEASAKALAQRALKEASAIINEQEASAIINEQEASAPAASESEI